MTRVARWIAARMHRGWLRRPVLWGIFRFMPRAVRRKALERENVVVEWHVTGRRDGKHDVRQLVIEEGAAHVLRGQSRDPDLVLTLDGESFLLLATGNASGPRLYVTGALGLEGDPWLAMRLPKLFALR